MQADRILKNGKVFSVKADGSIIRGSAVAMDVLYQAIASHQIAAAAIDVAETEPLPPDSPLWGLDDLVISAYTQPAITTMGLDKIAMGRQAMATMFQMMNGGNYDCISLLPTTLVERGSVKVMGFTR